MVTPRPSELAGLYYPQDPKTCRAQLESWPALEAPQGELIGAIVPHGGWRYAGRIAAGTLQALKRQRPEAELIVVLGGHLNPREPIRTFMEGAWATPLGEVPTPESLAQTVAIGLSAEPETAEEYYDDNAVEVLMPMLRWLWPDVPALVIGTPPDTSPGDVAAEIHEQTQAAGTQNNLIIGSADLTHYGADHRFRPHGQGPTAHQWVMEDNDRSLIELIENLDAHQVLWEGPRKRNTCSPGAVAVALLLAKKWGAQKGYCLEQTTSWLEDGRPPEMRSFVGYAGVVLGRF